MRQMLIVVVMTGCTGTDTPTDSVDTGPLVPAANQPPVVDVGDLTLFQGEQVELNAVATDPDGDPLTYLWLFRTKPPLSRVALSDPTGASVSFLPDRLGHYLFELVVSDGEHQVTASPLVTVLSNSERPLADAGEDRVIAVGREAVLDGSASQDPDGRYLFYDWWLDASPKGSIASLTSADAVTTFVPDVVGDYLVELRVHNGSFESGPDELLLTAVPDHVVTGDTASGELLPSQVYLFGRVDKTCLYGWAHWSDPATVMAGVDLCRTDIRTMQMTPDGTVLLLDFDRSLTEVACDGCPTWTPGDALDTKTLHDNDTVVDTAPCDGKTHELPWGLLVAPDGALRLYCDGAWRDPDDHALNFSAVAAGPSGTLLDSRGNLANLVTGKTQALAGLPAQYPLARGVSDGFLVAGAAHGSLFLDTVWHVDAATGKVTVRGTYTRPPSVSSSAIQNLDADGTLFRYGYDASAREYRLFRYRTDGLSDQVGTGTADPGILAISRMMTGVSGLEH